MEFEGGKLKEVHSFTVHDLSLIVFLACIFIHSKNEMKILNFFLLLAPFPQFFHLNMESFSSWFCQAAHVSFGFLGDVFGARKINYTILLELSQL